MFHHDDTDNMTYVKLNFQYVWK